SRCPRSSRASARPSPSTDDRPRRGPGPSARASRTAKCDRTSSGKLVCMLTAAARLLGDAERQSVERLLDQDPYGGAQVAERIAMAGLAWWRQDARVFGYGSRRHLESLCWLGANLIP